MAQLQLKVGNLVSTVDASDTNATRILQAMIERHGFVIEEMSGQEQVDAVIKVITDFIVNSAIAQEVDIAATIARESVVNAPPSWE